MSYGGVEIENMIEALHIFKKYSKHCQVRSTGGSIKMAIYCPHDGSCLHPTKITKDYDIANLRNLGWSYSADHNEWRITE